MDFYRKKKPASDTTYTIIAGSQASPLKSNAPPATSCSKPTLAGSIKDDQQEPKKY